MSSKRNKKAFSLVEIILAITMFSLTIIVVGSLILEGVRSTKNQTLKNSSIYAIKEIYNAVTVVKNDLWSAIVNNTNDGPKHLVFANNIYTIEDGTAELDGVTLSFTISIANRDSSGNIVLTGGTPDPHTRVINILASWIDVTQKENTVTSTIYVNDWNTLEWYEDTVADFNDGTNNQTTIQSTLGGEIQLQRIFFPDWCKPTLAINEYDIPGNATAKTIFSEFTDTGISYLGTGGSSDGVAFTKVIIDGVEDPIITVEGEFNGYLTNNIFVSGDYAYLGTTQDSKEVVILDLTTTPYAEVGYYNTPRTEDANGVWVVGDVGYVAAGRYVYSFNLTQKTGSRSIIGSLQVSQYQNLFQVSKVSQIIVRGNYLFASLDQDWYEMSIVNVANPASMTIASHTNVNNQQSFDIFVSPDGNRTYFGTGSSSSEQEFFIINTSTKTGNNRPIIGQYDTNGMSVRGISIIERDKRAILVGYGAEEYQAVDLTTETSPSRCGGMQLDNGINDVDSVIDTQGNAFSYLLTNDSAADFRVLRGGPGGAGDETGYGYLATGEYTSGVYDTGSNTSSFYYQQWQGNVPPDTFLRLQYRAGNSADLSAIAWVGPDDTNGSYFDTQNVTNFPASFVGKRYIQYRAYFSSDTLNTSTPRLDLVRVNYQK
mgnify:CR=1 FL=1